MKKLFLLYISIDYFEKKLKKLIKTNTGFSSFLKEKISKSESPDKMCYFTIEKFLFETEQNRVNHKKVILYFESKFKRMMVEDFFQWAYSGK